MTPKTFLFMPESAYGPTNNCIGIGNVLRQRGHRVVFAAEASWAGRLEPLGFVEDLVDLAAATRPTADGAEQDAGQFWTDFIRETAPEFRKPTIEQLDSFIRPTWQALIDGARYSHEQLAEIIERNRPDVVVEDNVCCFPALLTAGVPFVRIMSCNPLEVRGADVPPVFSGYPSDDPTRMGRVPRRVRPHPPADVGGVRRVGAQLRRAATARPRLHPRQRAAQPLPLPGGARLHRPPPARRDVASPRLVGAHDRRGLRAARVAARQLAGSRTARWSTCRSARSARPTSS